MATSFQLVDFIRLNSKMSERIKIDNGLMDKLTETNQQHGCQRKNDTSLKYLKYIERKVVNVQ